MEHHKNVCLHRMPGFFLCKSLKNKENGYWINRCRDFLCKYYKIPISVDSVSVRLILQRKSSKKKSQYSCNRYPLSLFYQIITRESKMSINYIVRSQKHIHKIFFILFFSYWLHRGIANYKNLKACTVSGSRNLSIGFCQ